MAKEVITVHGEEVLVRDDTAKAFRGVKWGHIVVVFILLFIVILAIGLYVSGQ